MSYSVNDLNQNLSEHVLNMGVNEKFLENPAYSSVISKINSLIIQMNIGESYVNVREENEKISFQWDSKYGNKYSMNISNYDSKTFGCIMTEDKIFGVNTNNRIKNFIEIKATIEDDGTLTLITNGSMIDNLERGINKCYGTGSAERMIYDSSGIMILRECKNYSRSEISVGFDAVTPDNALYIPRNAFNNEKVSYNSMTTLRRDKLDTARVFIDDKTNGIRYSATTVLNTENGLSDMVMSNGFNYQQEVVIPPLPQEQVEVMIQKERNPKVAEGLRKYAEGRDKYFYNSYEDRGFQCVGVSEYMAERLVQGMENGNLDLNGQPITQNNGIDNNTRTMGFSGIWLLGLLTGIMSCAFVILGIILS